MANYIEVSKKTKYLKEDQPSVLITALYYKCFITKATDSVSGVTKSGLPGPGPRHQFWNVFRNENLSLYPVTTIKLCASS